MAAELVALGRAEESRSWSVGAEGEELAASLFAGLPVGWTVLHDVPVGVQGANVDHVLISRAGVFTVNTKHHLDADVAVYGGQTYVRGFEVDHVIKADREGRRASLLLSQATGMFVPVFPILLFVGAKSVTVKKAPAHVVVADEHNVLGYLTSMEPDFSDEELDRVQQAAVRPGTWARPAKRGGWGSWSLATPKPPRGSRPPSAPRTPRPPRQPRVRRTTTRRRGGVSPGLRLMLLLAVALGLIAKGPELAQVVADAVAPVVAGQPDRGTRAAWGAVAQGRFAARYRSEFPRSAGSMTTAQIANVGMLACGALGEQGTGQGTPADTMTVTREAMGKDVRTTTVRRAIGLAAETVCPDLAAEAAVDARQG